VGRAAKPGRMELSGVGGGVASGTRNARRHAPIAGRARHALAGADGFMTRCRCSTYRTHGGGSDVSCLCARERGRAMRRARKKQRFVASGSQRRFLCFFFCSFSPRQHRRPTRHASTARRPHSGGGSMAGGLALLQATGVVCVSVAVILARAFLVRVGIRSLSPDLPSLHSHDFFFALSLSLHPPVWTAALRLAGVNPWPAIVVALRPGPADAAATARRAAVAGEVRRLKRQAGRPAADGGGGRRREGGGEGAEEAGAGPVDAAEAGVVRRRR
jgi:hypothetical protein